MSRVARPGRLAGRAAVWPRPTAIGLAGVVFPRAGIFHLTRAGDMALSPWAMAIPCGTGKIGTAALLYWNLERANP